MIEYGTLEAVGAFLKGVGQDPYTAAEKLAVSIHDADENEARRERLREAVGLLSANLRDRIAANLKTGVAPLLKSPVGETAGADRLLVALQKLDNLRQRIDGNVNLKLACDAIALEWPAAQIS